MHRDLFLLLMLQRMSFLNTKEKLIVLENCSSPELLPRKKTLEILIGRHLEADYSRDSLLNLVDSDLRIMLKSEIKTLFIGDQNYPRQLKEIHNPPFLLYCKGLAPPEDALNISVVGTRKATGRALEEAYAFSFDLARSGVSVISGLAEGIDSAAHKGALDGRSYTAAVFGCGVDKVYPLSNKKLAFSILDKGGTLMSEYPPGTIPAGCHFPERNRIISALSEATVVVEASGFSGSLITAEFALEQGRDVFILQSPERGDLASGNRNLLNDGALSVSSASELLKNLSYRPKDLKERVQINQNFDSSETGGFLAGRFLAELRGQEICKKGIYYCL